MLKKLKIFLPLFIGFFLIYYSYNITSIAERKFIINSIIKADYKYIFLSFLIGILSHLSRAHRWRYMLNPLGFKIKFYNSLMALMAGYVTNFGIPRSGELLRATSLYAYEKVDFEKGFGTIITERIIDLIILFCCVLIGISIYPSLWSFNLTLEPRNVLVYFSIFLFLASLIYILIKKMSKSNKIISFLLGLKNGLISVLIMPKKEKFIFHTFFIWIMYFLMIYITKFSIPETSSLGFEPIFIAFIAGTIALSTTNGGIGVYPLAIAAVLNHYDVSYEAALAFGWLAWTTQTVLIILFGSLSFIFFPILNKN